MVKMLNLNSLIPESFKKRICRYLLQRFLGQYLQNKISLEQLEVDLYKGSLSIKSVSLDCNALNEFAAELKLPIVFVDGYIEEISINIPWSNLLSENSSMEIQGFHVAVSPNQHMYTSFSLESMWNSMTSSVTIASECMKQDEDTGGFASESLDLFAKTIESVATRIQVKLLDTSLRVEHCVKSAGKGIAIEVQVKSILYCDETETECIGGFSTKKLIVDGVSVFMEEFEPQNTMGQIFRSTWATQSKVFDSDELDPEPGQPPPPPILIGKFTGRHELKVRLKLNEQISGPKVDLNFHFGSFLAYLTPREFHNIRLVAEAFGEKPRSMDVQRNIKEKLMASTDFRRIEAELHRQMNEPTLQSSNLFQSRGWGSSESPDEDDIFFPTRHCHSGKIPDLLTNGNACKSMSATIFQSAFAESSSVPTKSNSDNIARFKVRIGSLVCILLHNDILTSDISSGKFVWSLQSALEMEKTLEFFFDTLGPFSLFGKDRNFEDGCQKLDEACTKSHIRILAAPITLEGSDQEISSIRHTEFTLTFGNMEVSEVLRDTMNGIEVSPLLTFPETGTQNGTANFSLTCKQQTPTQTKSKSRKPSVQPTQITVTLASCASEVDISLADRLTALIGGFTAKGRSKADSQSVVSFELQSSILVINLRFPIPDLRPVYQRQPWWKRTVRPDIMRLEVTNALVKTAFSSAPQQCFQITGKVIRISHMETSSSEPVEVVRLFPDDDQLTNMNRLGWPQIKLVTTAVDQNGLLDTFDECPHDEIQMPNIMAMSIGEALNGLLNPDGDDLNPFQTRTRIRNPEGPKDKVDLEEILLPSDPSTLIKLSDSLSSDALVHLTIDCPNVVVSIDSKRTYEAVYNRLSTDLAFWEPCAPGNKPKPEPQTNQELGLSPFVMCKSGIHISDSDSEGDDTFKTRAWGALTPPLATQTKFVFNLNIIKGLLRLKLPPLDEKHDDCGEIELELYDLWLSSITHAKGDPHSGYLLMYAQSGAMRHRAVDEHCVREIITDHDESAVLFQMAMKLEVDDKTRMKNFRTAVQVRHVDMQYIVAPFDEFWVNRLVDFLDVKDTQIQGYKPSTPLTELHLTFDNCDVGYIPLNFPARALLSVGSFSLTSNIVAQTNMSVLRCILEDSNGFLANSRNSEKFAQILELDFAELCIRICNSRKPRVDLTCGVSKVVLKTCSDSSRLLVELLNYIAAEGDASAKQETVSQNSPLPSQDVCGLMEDALQESVRAESSEREPLPHHTEVFFFPDENNRSMFRAAGVEPAQDAAMELPTLEQALEEAMGSSPSSVKSLEDFCMVDDMGVASQKNLEPEVRSFASEPIKIQDNHFAPPLSVTDILKAPKHFPLPVARYTLSEMNVVWCLYGGSDFALESAQEKKVKSGHSVRFADQCPPEVHFTSKVSEENHIKIVDPVKKKRDAEVSMELHLVKVRFQHDEYPPEEVQAGRQVLSISDIEIRDRLPTSTINKFLCRDCSEARPRQANVNMLLVKVLQVRPEVGSPSIEHCLKVSLLPIRLHIDQDALFFLADFFSDVNSNKEKVQLNVPVDEIDEDVFRTRADSTGSEGSASEVDGSSQMFFRTFAFTNEVSIRIDYEGKRLELRRGAIAGILAGLGQLTGAEIHLKRLNCRHGILGPDRVALYAITAWLQDIKRRQLPAILGGVGPMYSIIQLGQGVRDLFMMPIEQYQKDGRLVRGIQRGASAFGTSAVLAVLELTSRFVHIIQSAAETAYDVLSSGPSVRQGRNPGRQKKNRRRGTHPSDLREGVSTAYQNVKEGLTETAKNFVQNSNRDYDQKGVTGAVGGVLRQIPPAVVKPFILASEATATVLDGLQSQLRPEARREASDKWRMDD